MIEKIKKEIADLLQKTGVTGGIELTSPPKPEMGDFALACFGVGKEWGMNPVEAAKKIASSLVSRNSIIEKIEPMGPYVNFYLRTAVLAELVITEIQQKKNKYGQNTSGKGKKVLIEYPSPNTHKEFHIGHFRNVCIGNALVQLYQNNGYKVYPVSYINDFGSHVAKCLWALEKFHKDEIKTPPKNKQKWLGEVYAEAAGKLKEHPEFAAEVAQVQIRLEGHSKVEYWPLFAETRKWSIEKFEQIFKELRVKHVVVLYEKDLKDKGQKMVDDLLKKGIAQVGEGGAIIIDLNKYNLDIALLRKSNGAGLYLTSDLPLAMEKFKQCNADESIVVTGTEQNFYFKQLYKILELMGFNKKLTHIGYGLVNLKEGKMSSRLGNVVLYEELYDSIFSILKSETQERHSDWSEKKINTNTKILAMAALKFDTQKHEAAKNIVFDAKEAASFEGFTGPYVLYVIARINSILKKAKGKTLKVKDKFDLLDKPEEKQLLMLLAKYEEVVQQALADYNPSVITRYCFDLAQAFNDFYNKHSILKTDNTELATVRLALSLAVKQVLENGLDLLSIDFVEEM